MAEKICVRVRVDVNMQNWGSLKILSPIRGAHGNPTTESSWRNTSNEMSETESPFGDGKNFPLGLGWMAICKFGDHWKIQSGSPQKGR